MEPRDAEIHGGGREMSRAFRVKLWIYGRKIHTDFTVTLVSLVRNGTRFSVYVKGLPKRIHLTDQRDVAYGSVNTRMSTVLATCQCLSFESKQLNSKPKPP